VARVEQQDVEAIPGNYKRRRLVNGIACQARYWNWKELLVEAKCKTLAAGHKSTSLQAFSQFAVLARPTNQAEIWFSRVSVSDACNFFN